MEAGFRWITVLLILLFSFPVYSADSASSRLVSVEHAIHDLQSAQLSEQRRVLVRVPNSYSQSNQRYPVVYLLDGGGSYITQLPGIIDTLTETGNTPEMIVISIPNIDRRRDFTPTHFPKWPSTGGAEKFLNFIEKELIPYIDSNYRTEPYRIFIGHSLGGLLVIHSYLTRPKLFNAYIAASPVLQWDSLYPVKQAEQLLPKHPTLPHTLFAALGDEPPYVEAFNAFQDVLKKTAPPSLDYEFQQFKNEDHGTITTPTFHLGLKKIWSQWRAPKNSSLDELEKYYTLASVKYGFYIKIPLDAIERLGYRLLQTEQLPEAIRVLKRAIELHSDSPRTVDTYSYLAEAFEKNKDLDQARKNYESGLQLAIKTNNLQIQQFFQKEIKRLSNL
jgi:predicted alpha/beta superfamily hydrolase